MPCLCFPFKVHLKCHPLLLLILSSNPAALCSCCTYRITTVANRPHCHHWLMWPWHQGMCCVRRAPSTRRRSRNVCWIELGYWNSWAWKGQFISGKTFSQQFSDLKFMLPFLEYSVKYIELYKYIYILLFLATAYWAIQYEAFYFQHLEHSGRFDYWQETFG